MIQMTRPQAEANLQQIFGIAHFYDEQWKAIDALLHGRRILMIERTGFGKSLCFQFPAVLFEGVTVVFSPLIALMRDQVQSLQKKGISARCVNSEETPASNQLSLEDAQCGKVKILYIAPERQENLTWQNAIRNMRLSMVVVDEAHTVSQWGHDFRPAFRRIKNLVRNYLPADMPILATTATATEYVQHDIEQQLGSGLTTIRGNLIRPNFRLFVIETQSEEEKMIWLRHHLPQLEGTGLVYAGTRVKTLIYTRWFNREHIDAVEYNAGLDAATRIEIEAGFMTNRWKCIVTTNALGMGIDKPDIRFVIHLQMPASPIHYYQEIGRAGRDGKPTVVILFFNSNRNKEGMMEDCTLPLSFIDNARPSEKKYKQFMEAVQEELLGEKELMMKTNLNQVAVRVIREDLIDQEIIKEVMVGRSKKYEYQFNAPALDFSRYEALNVAKRNDLRKMVEYIRTKESRMKFLCHYLGDQGDADYSNTCDNSGLQKLSVSVNEEDRTEIEDFNRSFFPEIPSARYTKMITGVAASYYGVSNVGQAIHRCKYENGGDFPNFLVSQTLSAYRHAFANRKFDMIVYVPATVSGDLVKHFAHTIGSILKMPVSDGLIKTRVTEAQKIFQQRYGKAENVKEAFDYLPHDAIKGKTILLIDDIYDSGATIKEIGKMLTKLGATEIAPLVIAKTVGGDDI